MQKLMKGLHHFQNQVFSSKQELFERLRHGQNPDALFITCSDSRINPNLITQTEPGEIFILRNAGNIIPPHGAANGGEGATIEYAVKVLGVKDIIVCGHSHCGAVTGLVSPGILEDLPQLKAWLGYSEATRAIIESNYTDLDEASKLNIAVQENVLVQLENLKTHPAVAVALAKGALSLHAWVYKFETGEVFGYNPDEGQFMPLLAYEPKPVSSPRQVVSI